MSQYGRLLQRNPEYTKLWFAQVVSLTGDWFNTVVLSSMVAEFSGGSGIAISIFLMLRVLPQLIMAPVAGVLLDRFNRKHLLIWSNLLRAAIVPIYLFANSPDSLWVIYLVTVLQFTLSAVWEPGQSAIIPALLVPEDIISGNTLLSVTWSVMLSLGAILGGVFAYSFGATAALIADAITFVFAGLLLMWIKYDPLYARQLAINPSETIVEDTSFQEGLRYVRSTPQMLAALFIKFAQSFGNIDTLLTILGTQIFILGAQGELSLGILYSALGLGAMIGPIFSNRFNDGSVYKMRRLVSVGFLLMLVSWPLLGIASSLWLVAIAIFIRAMGGSINWTYSNVIIQKTAPDAKLGRMFSMDMIGFYTSTIITLLAHGWLIDTFGISNLAWIIWGTMLVTIIPSLIWWLSLPYLERLESATHNQPSVATGD